MVDCRVCGIELTDTTKYHRYKGNICKECVKEYQNHRLKNLPYEKRIRHKVSKTLSNHKYRGIEVIGAVDDFLGTFKSHCFYCDEKFDLYGDFKDAGSLDIIDPSKPMTPDNVQWLCYTCNAGKNHLSHEMFMDKIRRIYEKHLEE